MESGAKYTLYEENKKREENKNQQNSTNLHGYHNLIFHKINFNDIKKMVNPSVKDHVLFTKSGVKLGYIKIIFSHQYIRGLQSVIYELYKFMYQGYKTYGIRELFDKYFKDYLLSQNSNIYKIVNEPKEIFCDGYYGPKTYIEMRCLLDIIITNFDIGVSNKDKIDYRKPYLTYGDVVSISYAKNCIEELHNWIKNTLESDPRYIIDNIDCIKGSTSPSTCTKEYKLPNDQFSTFVYSGQTYEIKYMDLPYNHEFDMASFLAGIQYYERHILNQNEGK